MFTDMKSTSKSLNSSLKANVNDLYVCKIICTSTSYTRPCVHGDFDFTFTMNPLRLEIDQTIWWLVSYIFFNVPLETTY